VFLDRRLNISIDVPNLKTSKKIMQIDRSSWHYRVWRFANLGSPSPDAPERHKKVNLCRYWWRIILMPVPVTLLFFILFVFFCAFVASVTLVGYGVYNFKDVAKGDDDITQFKPITVRGGRTFPMYAAVLGAYGFAAICFLTHLYTGIMGWIFLAAFAIVCLSAILWGIYVIVRGLFRSALEQESLTLARIKAHKNRLCPQVEFFDIEEHQEVT